MNNELISINAKWKSNFSNMFSHTPKNKRATIEQINSIRSTAKLLAVLYPNN